MTTTMLRICVGLLLSGAAYKYMPQSRSGSLFEQVQRKANQQFERLMGRPW